jgi:uncharacterized protein (DUF433 family)
MKWQKYIHQNPKILLGKPVFIGTRISVEMILDEMAAGDSVDQVIQAYPRLTRQHVRAALAFAAASLRHDETVFLEANVAT